MKKVYKRGFTLAETLITMVILGLLLTLYMPTLNRSYAKNATLASFSDSISSLNKALFHYSREQGAQGNLALTDLFSNELNNTAELLSKQFAPVKVGKNCWNGQKIYNNIDSKGDTTDLNDLSCFIDGNNRIYATDTSTFIGNCETDYRVAGYDNKHKLGKSCGLVFVDTNGTKSPNTFGKDVFIFIITNSSPNYLYPLGGTLLQKPAYSGLSTWLGTCGSDIENSDYEDISKLDGRTCAGRIIEDGMKVNYLK